MSRNWNEGFTAADTAGIPTVSSEDEIPDGYEVQEVIALPDASGSSIPDGWEDEDVELVPWDESWLKEKQQEALEKDNDFIVLIAPSSKSSISGVGKTTLAICFCRDFDGTEDGWSAEEKSTLDARQFARELMNNPDKIDDKSAALFDESQGTLSDSGADARRAMANSVLDVSRALATLRYRQITAVLVTQATGWIDDRIELLSDALVLIQDRGHAVVYTHYFNDLNPSKEYHERQVEIEWDALPEDDPDLQELHRLKEESTKEKMEQEDVTIELTKEQKVFWAQQLRDKQYTVSKIADIVEMSTGWVSEHTEAPDI